MIKWTPAETAKLMSLKDSGTSWKDIAIAFQGSGKTEKNCKDKYSNERRKQKREKSANKRQRAKTPSKEGAGSTSASDDDDCDENDEKQNPKNKNFKLMKVRGDGNCLYYSFLQSLSELYRKNRSLIPEEFRQSDGTFIYNIDWEEIINIQHDKVSQLRSKLGEWFEENFDKPAFDTIPTETLQTTRR